ncbi:TPA: hypothetical protein ACSA6A_005668 [Salmonella enterica subsp. enterica serovar Muenchen]
MDIIVTRMGQLIQTSLAGRLLTQNPGDLRYHYCLSTCWPDLVDP